MQMTPAQEFVFHRTYARWLEQEKRRETYPEMVDRYMCFFEDRFGDKVSDKIWNLLRKSFLDMKTMPSMRAAWAAGDALATNHITAYNCCALVFKDLRSVAEMFYILMCGTGVGFSVEKEFISLMPHVAPFKGQHLGIHVIPDSREGWADAVLMGLETWFAGKDIDFDYSKIRPKGSRLKTMGGRASGPDPLMKLVSFLKTTILSAQGRQLTSLEWLDVGNMLGEVTEVGGVRRAAEISFSDLEDEAIRFAKHPPYPVYRSQSNNTAVYKTKPDAGTFLKEWQALVSSHSGERGIFNLEAAWNSSPRRMEGLDKAKLSHLKYGMRTNPCAEINLLASEGEFCVAGDTPLITQTGIYPIASLQGQKVNVWNGKKWSEVEPRKTGSNRKLYRVHLSDGSYLDCTGHHRFSVKLEHESTYYPLDVDTMREGLSLYGRQYNCEPTVIQKFMGHETLSLSSGKRFFVLSASFNDAKEMQLMFTANGVSSKIEEEDTETGTEWFVEITPSTSPVYVHDINELPGLHDTYCFEEHEEHKAVFGNVLTYQCNLSEIVVRNTDAWDDILDKAEAAVWFGAMQACLTDFPYIRSSFKKTCDMERLLGVSLTGQMDNPELMTAEKLQILKNWVLKTTKKACKALGVNMSAAVTTGKPSGCRPWDALTVTDKGILTLEELLVDHKQGETWSPMKEAVSVIQGDQANRILRTYDNGSAESLEIELSYGLSIQSTTNHMWSVRGQWVVTSDLKVGDVLDVIPGSYQEKRSSILHPQLHDTKGNPIHYMNADLAWLLGYLWGNNTIVSYADGTICMVEEKLDVIEKLRQVLKDTFDVSSTCERSLAASRLDFKAPYLWEWLNKVDTWGSLIPLCVRESSKEHILAFIAGVFDFNGSVVENGFEEKFSISSRNWLCPSFRHLQLVSWSVGIALYMSGDYVVYSLGHTDTGSVACLADHSVLVEKYGNLYMHGQDLLPVMPVGTVESINRLGWIPTYDIEVENEHWYLNGPVKSHNTVSQLVNCSSGAHPRYAKYYIRRYRISATDPLFYLLRDQGVPFSPENGQRPQDVKKVQEEYWLRTAQSHPDWEKSQIDKEVLRVHPDWTEDMVTKWVVSFPEKSPDSCLTRHDVTALDQLEWYLKVKRNWCEHNQSITVYVRDEEWLDVGAWVYKHFDDITGISFLPYDGGSYEQAPYEELTEEQYMEMVKTFPTIDYSALSYYEMEDNTVGARTFACTANGCELN